MSAGRTTRRAALGASLLGAAASLRGLAPGRADGDPEPRDGAPALACDARVERVLMATPWSVVVPRGAPAGAVAAAEAALDEVARLEGVLTEFRPSSELSRVNAAAGERPVAVGADTWAVVSRALAWAERTDGAYDPTWAALRPLWDFARREGTPPSYAQVRARLPLVSWRAVRLDARARTVFLERRGMALGLGGIGKGYALDRARAVLEDAGLRDFLLYAGGQVLASGTRAGRPWRVGVQHPRAADALLATISLTQGSLATGGDYEHYFMHRGLRFHHLLDPRTGYPVEHTASVSVLLRSGLDADALESALFVLEPARAARLARELDVAVLRVGPDLETELSPAMRGLVELRGPLAGRG